MPFTRKKSHRGLKALVVVGLAVGGAVALAGGDIRRYLRMRTM